MATIKTSNTNMLVDELGQQLMQTITSGSQAGSMAGAVSGYMATDGAAAGPGETVKYGITDTKVSLAVDTKLPSDVRGATYTLTGTDLKDPANADATKLVFANSLNQLIFGNGISQATKSSTTGTATVSYNPYDTSDIKVTKALLNATYNVDTSGPGFAIKGNSSGTLSFQGLEQYGQNGNGYLELQTSTTNNSSLKLVTTLNQAGNIVTTKTSMALASKTGLIYEKATGALSGALDSLAYSSLATPNQKSIPPQLLVYNGGAFTADMLNALADAFALPRDQRTDLLKAALLSGDDVISGSAKTVNILEGGAGNDSVTGAAFSDMLYGEDGDDKLFGLAGNDLLVGGDGQDVLDGGAGVDNMIGGDGNDIYIADQALDLAWINLLDHVLRADDGYDEVRITYKGGTAGAPAEIDMSGNLSDVEVLSIAGTGVFRVEGNDLSNVLDAGKTASVLVGGAGDDFYYVNAKGASVVEDNPFDVDTVIASVSFTLGDYVDNLNLVGKAAINGTGNSLDNTLIGNDGANILDGGAGVDNLDGGKGNDTYIVDDLGDSVTEVLNSGSDTIKSSVSFTLGANLENLTLTGAAQANNYAIGNELNNTITGDAGNNAIDGGAGVDKLAGGLGNDSYSVDLLAKGVGAKAIAALQDTVSEAKGAGVDTLQLRASLDTQTALANASKATTLTLGANLENLDASATGSLKLNLTGNAANNELVGNNAANTLTGGAGNDALDGGAGADILIGGLGTDTLTGGSGSDTFSFTSLKDLGLGAAQDVIEDFTSGEDLLSFKALKGWTFDAAATNATGAKQLWAVVDGADTIVYGNSGGSLAADFSIKLVGVTAVAETDFVLA